MYPELTQMTTITAQVRIEDEIDFAVATAKLVPMVFLLDVSSSMSSMATDSKGKTAPKIEGLKQGLQEGLDYIRQDPLLKGAARVNLIPFNSKATSTGFQPIDKLPTPKLVASGCTAMRAALSMTARDTEAFLYKQNADGVNVATATVLMISDGEGTDGSCADVMRTLLMMKEQRIVHLIGAGINSEDAYRLRALGFSEVHTLSQMTWKDLIQLATVSAKRLASGQQPTADSMTGGV
jgi:uncharacterized protein YegL